MTGASIIVAVHVLFGLAGTITGIHCELSPKRSGRHPWCGTIYYWCLAGVFVTAGALAAARWAEGYTGSFSERWPWRPHPWVARRARKRWGNWVKLHMTGRACRTFCC